MGDRLIILRDETTRMPPITLASGENAQTSVTICVIEDLDSEGVDDAWEAANDMDPKDPTDGATDPDADGLDQTGEFEATTDPKAATPTAMTSPTGWRSATAATPPTPRPCRSPRTSSRHLPPGGQAPAAMGTHLPSRPGVVRCHPGSDDWYAVLRLPPDPAYTASG